MNYKPNKDSKNYKKIDPIYRHNNHICRCHCHNKIKNKSLNNHLILSDENSSNFNIKLKITDKNFETIINNAYKINLIIVSLIKHQSSNLIIYKVNYLLSIIFFT